MKVAILVLQNSLISAITSINDIFTISNGYCKSANDLPFETSFVSTCKELNHTNIVLKTKLIDEHDNYDIIIIPPLMETIEVNKEQNKLNSWLIQMYHKGTLLTAVCAGSIVLANSGLLDYKRATTHWLYESLFKEKFPKVDLQCELLLIDEGHIITAGGMSAYVDLALYLVEKYHSKQSADICANLLLIDRGRDSQLSYKNLSSTLLVEDKEMKKLLSWMKKNLHKELTTKKLAKKMNIHERTLLRQFKKTLNLTPNQYLQNLRIEEAKALLMNTQKSFNVITDEVGFNNESSFRRLFKRETSLNPGEYRKKFQNNML
jgi:transcriptional regulator GlxA family with amidase domain